MNTTHPFHRVLPPSFVPLFSARHIRGWPAAFVSANRQQRGCTQKIINAPPHRRDLIGRSINYVLYYVLNRRGIKVETE